MSEFHQKQRVNEALEQMQGALQKLTAEAILGMAEDEKHQLANVCADGARMRFIMDVDPPSLLAQVGTGDEWRTVFTVPLKQRAATSHH